MKHTKIDGLWRITSDKGEVLKDAKKNPLDRGGHEHVSDSIYHAELYGIKEKKRSKQVKLKPT